jgi:hypothetical protein
MSRLLHCWIDWFRPLRGARRYRVTPRVNPAVMRRNLHRTIRAQLRHSGILTRCPQ